MVESRMAEEDEFGRPLRFTPTWPPRPVPKPTPSSVPQYSMVFRKSSWPPQKDDDVTTEDPSAVSGQDGASRPEANLSGSTNQRNTSEAVISNTVKPKAVRDYSSFFGKNQKALVIPVRPKSLQPDAIALPEAFTGNPDEEAAE